MILGSRSKTKDHWSWPAPRPKTIGLGRPQDQRPLLLAGSKTKDQHRSWAAQPECPVTRRINGNTTLTGSYYVLHIIHVPAAMSMSSYWPATACPYSLSTSEVDTARLVRRTRDSTGALGPVRISCSTCMITTSRNQMTAHSGLASIKVWGNTVGPRPGGPRGSSVRGRESW